jgi:hypothetical protein
LEKNTCPCRESKPGIPLVVSHVIGVANVTPDSGGGMRLKSVHAAASGGPILPAPFDKNYDKSV